jgi:transposase
VQFEKQLATMTETKSVCSKAFKGKAAELSAFRGNMREVAHELGIRPELLHRWRSEIRSNHNEDFSGHGIKQLTEEQRNLGMLKKELAEARIERDIITKAVRIFSKSNAQSTGSKGTSDGISY